MMEKVAVVILNYNGASFLQTYLPTLIKHSFPYPIIVADNASTDQSLILLNENFPNIRVIQLDKNHGFAGGYNEALMQIDSKYFMLVNSDIQVTENWIQPLIDFLDENSEYDAVQPKIRSMNQPEYFEYAGAAGGYLDSFGYPYCRGRIFNQIEKDNHQYDDISDVNWTSGACMLIRSETFRNLDGFDVTFFAHMEEIDLCWRIANTGKKMACIPTAVVYHVGGGTLSKTNPFKTYLNFRNGLTLLIKNLPTPQLWKIPIRIFLDWVASFYMLLNGFDHFKAVYRAHFYCLKNIKKTIDSRNRIALKISNFSNLYILTEYHIKGKKKFSELNQ